MTICNFNIKRVTCAPSEANPPLIVDANTMIAFSVPFQSFQLISWWNLQVTQLYHSIKNHQLLARNTLNALRQLI